mgnify:CR=1 FL=1|tara:strand:- start:907 stop:1290 length:384 start_codon:yes stop_codon:yes gene_type:complete
MGRPTKYNDEIIEKAEDYIKNYITYGDQIPMIDGLALELGVHRETINQWEKTYPEFSDIVRGLMTKQGRVLMNGSLSGEFRERTATLALSSNHGLVARSETDITSSDGSLKQPTKIQLVGVRADVKD